MKQQHTELSQRILRRVAAAADADIRTTTKVALGIPVRGIVAERITEELRRAGISVPAIGTADDLEGAPSRAASGS